MVFRSFKLPPSCPWARVWPVRPSRLNWFDVRGLISRGRPWWLRRWRIHLQYRGPRFSPWVRKTPWRRMWQSTPGFLPGDSHGQRSLAGGSQWGHRVGQDWAPPGRGHSLLLGGFHSSLSRTCSPPTLVPGCRRWVQWYLMAPSLVHHVSVVLMSALEISRGASSCLAVWHESPSLWNGSLVAILRKGLQFPSCGWTQMRVKMRGCWAGWASGYDTDEKNLLYAQVPFEV